MSRPKEDKSPKVKAVKASSTTSESAQHYEFGGPFGVILIVFGLPVVTYMLFFMCNGAGCLSMYPVLENGEGSWKVLLDSDLRKTFKTLHVDAPMSTLPSWEQIFSFDACVVYVAWWVLQALFYMLLPGAVVKGVPLEDGTRLDYYMNGLLAFVLSIGLFLGGGYMNVFKLSYLYDQYVYLLTASILFSFALSFYLYISARISGKGLAALGNTGNPFYDFYMGHQLNPRIGNFDLKLFCEIRPGLILWVLVNISCIAKQYELYGQVSNSILMVSAFQFWYVLDCFLVESAVLTTMDIIQDGFGFMLAFGDLAWVPFTYTLQARYLVDYPQYFSTAGAAAIIGLQLLGYFIFRSANNQKNAFRRNPEDPAVAGLKYMKTDAGSRLLISGWWGMARHINYFGDWLMGVAWCLPCGFDHPIPYFYAIYFAILLIHRERRDEEKCSKKYKQDWERYCKIVPYRIIPYIY
eukprot:Nk52_evm2s219 gene=Nk52_evmTU2s219